jgi:hypothetical protein
MALKIGPDLRRTGTRDLKERNIIAAIFIEEILISLDGQDKKYLKIKGREKIKHENEFRYC